MNLNEIKDEPAPTPPAPTLPVRDEEDWADKYLPPIGVIVEIIEPKDTQNG